MSRFKLTEQIEHFGIPQIRSVEFSHLSELREALATLELEYFETPGFSVVLATIFVGPDTRQVYEPIPAGWKFVACLRPDGTKVKFPVCLHPMREQPMLSILDLPLDAPDLVLTFKHESNGSYATCQVIRQREAHTGSFEL